MTKITKGEGTFLRDPKINPPKVRKILESIGNEKVTTIKVIRTPLSKATEFLLNIASFGQLKQKMKDANIDTLFHLSMLINGKYVLEKNEVIMLYKDANAVKKDSDTLDVSVTTNVTINEMLEKTQKRMGDKYGPYDGKNNNCSVFLSNVLAANNLDTQASRDFINQKTDELFKSFPALTEKIVKAGTTAGAVVNRLVEGEGRPRRLYEAKDGRYYYMQNGKKKYVRGSEGMSQQQIVKINIGELVKPKKKKKRRKRKKKIVPRQSFGFTPGMPPPPPVFIQGRPNQPQSGDLKLLQDIVKLQLLDRKPTEIPKPVPTKENVNEVERLQAELKRKQEARDALVETIRNMEAQFNADIENIGRMADAEVERQFRQAVDMKNRKDEEIEALKQSIKEANLDIDRERQMRLYYEDEIERMTPLADAEMERLRKKAERAEKGKKSQYGYMSSYYAIGQLFKELKRKPNLNEVNAYLREFAGTEADKYTKLSAKLMTKILKQHQAEFDSLARGESEILPVNQINFEKIGDNISTYRQSARGAEVPVENTCPPCNIYTALNLGMSSLPFGIANNNPLIKTDGLTGATTSSTAPTTTAPETKKDEPQKPDVVQGKGRMPFNGVLSRTLGFGYGMFGGCHGMDMCQCGGAEIEEAADSDIEEERVPNYGIEQFETDIVQEMDEEAAMRLVLETQNLILELIDRAERLTIQDPNNPNIQRLLDQIDETEELLARFRRQHGLGMGGADKNGVDALYNDEIEKIAEEMGYNVPVIASDQIGEILKQINSKTEEFGFIMNTDDSKGPGEHWVAFFINNADDLPSIEYFDPLGDGPTPNMVEGMKRIADKISSDKYFLFKENMVKRQPDSTYTCGYHALKFLEDRFNGVPFVEATGFDKCMDQTGEGEKEILKVVKRYDSYL
jgi:hypothetical protein